MSKIAVFDVNETTLDLAPVRAAVDDIFGRHGAFDTWFARLLQISMAVSATGNYLDFSALAMSALGSVAQTEQHPLPDNARAALGAAMGGLQAHPDVVDGLDQLRDGGWTLVALTNSAQTAVDAQLVGAGIADKFDHVLSVDLARTFKPQAAAYHLVSAATGADLADMWMVAAHDWDLAGAKAVGMSTAFVSRPGMPFADAYPAADCSVESFGQLADAMASGRGHARLRGLPTRER